VRTDRDLGRPVVEETDLHALGFSGEVKVLKTQEIDLKAYGTFHKFIGGGDGIALGALGRFNLGEGTIHAFRARAELRSFGDRYLPGYFDTLYEVSKYQTVQSQDVFQVAPTKYQWVFGDPENGFVLPDDPRHFGYDLELSWGMFGGSRSRKQVAAAIGASESTRDQDTNFHAHLEVPILKWLQVYGTFIRANARNLGDVFTGSPENVIVLSGLRVQIFPFLFANASYIRMYRILRSAGREFHLGEPSQFFERDRIFENVDTLYVDIEFGWEFRE
jgi:hypothetical protein